MIIYLIFAYLFSSINIVFYLFWWVIHYYINMLYFIHILRNVILLEYIINLFYFLIRTRDKNVAGKKRILLLYIFFFNLIHFSFFFSLEWGTEWSMIIDISNFTFFLYLYFKDKKQLWKMILIIISFNLLFLICFIFRNL